MPHTAAKTGGHPHPPPRVRKTELAALGLIGWRPMHGYALSQVFQELGLEHWTTISRSSIYTALRRLARAGAVSITREKEGGAPERTVYHLTPAGRALLREILLEALGYVGPEDRYFYLGLSLLPAVEAQAALPVLRDRCARLEAILVREREHKQNLKRNQPQLEHIVAMVAAGERHMETELACCQAIIDLLERDPGYLTRIRETKHAD